MSHEPECQYQPWRPGGGMIGVDEAGNLITANVTAEQEFRPCTCDIIRAAYQRGREDAATAVAMGEIPKENNAPLDPTWNAAIEWGALAARGDGAE